MMVSYTESTCCIWFKPGGFLQGGTVMRQAAFIQGDLGWRPVSASRPCPWWTCSHGEVIHDVSSVSCRWRTDRGPKKSTSLFFLLFYCTCLLSNQSTESNCLRKKKGFYCCRDCCVTSDLYSCWVSFPVGQIQAHCRRAKMWCFVFPWDFKMKVMSHTFLIYFHFIDGDGQFTSVKYGAIGLSSQKSRHHN